MFTKILVPLDGSDVAARAIATATEIARRFGARLLLVTVVGTGDATFALGANAAVGGMTDPAAITGEVAARVAAAQAYLAATAEAIAADGIGSDYEVRDGDEADAIIAAAGAGHADLIVLSSHGHSGLGRAVFGSVTDGVVRRALVPVLVVRAAA